MMPGHYVDETMLWLGGEWEKVGRTLPDGTVMPGQMVPVSLACGPDLVALLLIAAWLTDQQLCVTSDRVTRYIGLNRSTAQTKLRDALHAGWIEETDAVGCDCVPNLRHFKLTP